LTRPRSALLLVAGLVALGLPLLASPAAAASSVRSSVTMYSDPGDYIGGGRAQLFDSNNAQVTANGSRNRVFVGVSGGTAGTSFTLSFAAPDRTALRVASYPRAARESFRPAGRPGIDIYGDGRGCNEVAGSFEVRDIAYTAGGALSRLHLLYEQHCEGGTPALFGEVRYKVPTAPGLSPESSSVSWPPTYTRAAATVVPVTFRAVGRAVSVASVRVTGPDATSFPIRVDECTGARVVSAGSCQVLVRLVPAGPGPRSATLVVTDGSGRATTVQLDGTGRTGRTGLTITGEEGDWVSKGRSYAFLPATADITVRGDRQRVTARVASGSDDFFVTLQASPGDVLAPGAYPGATRAGFNGSAPGLDVSGNGAGCNTLTGSFTVQQALFSPVDGSVEHLRATFEQHCEGAVPGLRGELAYSAAADVSGPARVTGLQAAATGAGIRLTWTDPGGDGQRTVVRVAPGTVPPSSATTGLAVRTSGSQAVATGLTPGEPYAFAVFTVDRAGNVGSPAAIRATAGAGSPTLEV
jgi:hypothetical protein